MLVAYMNSQFSLLQNLDFFIRLIVACLCGAMIGVERTRRFKGAGIRTHIIVCCAAALMMIVSKYGFADLVSPDGVNFSGVRGADSARIAAQVVSGISFLGAGVIFKHGNAVRGLTTAAGLWATAGIGLAIGAGMYPIGIFGAVLVALLQVLMHKFVLKGDSLNCGRLQFTIQDSPHFREQLDAYIKEQKLQFLDTKVSYLEDGYISCDFVIRAAHPLSLEEWDRFLQSCGSVKSIGCTPVI